MTERLSTGRHRATVRLKTPLDSLTSAVAGNAATVGRRTAVIVAASGLVMSTAGLAQAAPANPDTASSSNKASVSSIMEAGQKLSIPDSAVASVDALQSEAVTPPPPPPVVKRTTTTSRSTTRTAIAPAATETTAPAAAETYTPAPGQSIDGNTVVAIASQYVGVPYVVGGMSPSGFDCSGFTSYVFAQVGVSLPRTSRAQQGAGTIVSAADAQPGDLVGFSGKSHIGIYAGGGMMYDAAHPGVALRYRAVPAGTFFIRVL